MRDLIGGLTAMALLVGFAWAIAKALTLALPDYRPDPSCEPAPCLDCSGPRAIAFATSRTIPRMEAILFPSP